MYQPTPADQSTTHGTTVLAIGNPIMGDDGIGQALLTGLMAMDLRQPVEFVDGGTIGMSLLPSIQDAHSLLVLDAVLGAGPPGTLVQLDGDQLPRLLAAKLSPHQVGFLDALASARLLGHEPQRLTVVGLIPGDVDLRVGLSEPVAGAVAAGVALAAHVLAGWWEHDDRQHAPQLRTGGYSCSGTSRST